MEETRLNFKRTHVGNRPNQSGCGWDPVNMKLNDRRVREEDLKEEERMRIKREMVEKRTNSESFDIVTHLERCSSRGKAKGGECLQVKTSTTLLASEIIKRVRYTFFFASFKRICSQTTTCVSLLSESFCASPSRTSFRHSSRISPIDSNS